VEEAQKFRAGFDRNAFVEQDLSSTADFLRAQRSSSDKPGKIGGHISGQ
jgi:hypothetical protein